MLLLTDRCVLQFFDAVGWAYVACKIVPEMTCYVSGRGGGGELNLTDSRYYKLGYVLPRLRTKFGEGPLGPPGTECSAIGKHRHETYYHW